jgi:hypothetical protein
MMPGAPERMIENGKDPCQVEIETYNPSVNSYLSGSKLDHRMT